MNPRHPRDTAEPVFGVSKSRLETLLDGVFAIAMTLMVLEIKVPHLADRRGARELLSALAANLSPLAAFALSMLMLGMFWYRHHRQFHHLQRITRGILAINLAFLFFVALFPFAANLLGTYPTNPATFVIYLPCAGLLSLCLDLQWTWARRAGLLSRELSEAAIRSTALQNHLALGLISVLITLLGAGFYAAHLGVDPARILALAWITLPLAIGFRLFRWWKRI